MINSFPYFVHTFGSFDYCALTGSMPAGNIHSFKVCFTSDTSYITTRYRTCKHIRCTRKKNCF